MNAKKIYLDAKNIITSINWHFNAGQNRSILKINQELENICQGKRCFILGNGPSLNLYDLSLLKSEYVFCTNEFVRFKEIESVQPDYYVMADPVFFEMSVQNSGDKALIAKILNLKNICPNVEFFLPLESKGKIHEYGWDDVYKIHYFMSPLIYNNNYSKKIRIDTIFSRPKAVVQYCIIFAVFMGFDEIYLLGTDQTNIFGNLKAFLSSEEISEYAFDMSEDERKWKNQKLTEYSLPHTLHSYAGIFELYDVLYIYCANQGVKLYNCAPETLIQGIPKKCFPSLF